MAVDVKLSLVFNLMETQHWSVYRKVEENEKNIGPLSSIMKVCIFRVYGIESCSKLNTILALHAGPSLDKRPSARPSPTVHPSPRMCTPNSRHRRCKTGESWCPVITSRVTSNAGSCSVPIYEIISNLVTQAPF